ncbi:MAG: phosphoenolpyruvate synthase [Rhodocyclaceae bacterium]|nr:phosphoenolpyruvate synthase [Rhodocyclaceae bacterium]
MTQAPYVVKFDQLRLGDVPEVGGKNASLGELISQLGEAGVRVPGGFATTATAYRDFLAQGGLDRRIAETLAALDVDDVKALAAAGERIRGWIRATPLPPRLEAELRHHYATLVGADDHAVAVRSSATAEDLPDASFAGQQETFLNIHGADHVIAAVREVFASLYNDRAISYRAHQGYAEAQVALSAGIQRMVRSDLGSAGVMFTLDTESGFRDAVFITSSYGLGEMVVQGAVNPDEFYVHKPMLAAGRNAIIRRELGSKLQRMVYASDRRAGRSTRVEDVPQALAHRFSLSDAEVLELARYAVAIEAHYGSPMDVEWGRDGEDGLLYVLQARPETVKTHSDRRQLEKYRLKEHGKVIATGRAIGQKIATGTVRKVRDPSEMERVRPGDVLVADMTDPNWEPIMKRAAAIVTNRGGRTCHAAIVARELGIAAIVGCGDATETLPEGEAVTVSCAEGDTGYVYRGKLAFEVLRQDLEGLPTLPLKVMMNVGNPELAFEFAQIPSDGVGLARIEFIINNTIGIHPKAILEIGRMPPRLREEIERRARGYANPETFFIEKLAEGVGTIAAAFWPRPVIVRLSDFKSNEYRKLLGGDIHEPIEENPMLGFRGASRYLASSFRDCFALECRALRKVRNEMGLGNVEIMVPFVRTLAEARGVVALLAEHGLKRGIDGLRLIMMCEIPSNALLADEFLEHFDGFSIGSNDLTQLTLGLDRDSGLVAHAFDERDAAVKKLLELAITAARRNGKYIGICGQGPSDHPDLAEWLMDVGIESVSLNPDTVIDTTLRLARHLGGSAG